MYNDYANLLNQMNNIDTSMPVDNTINKATEAMIAGGIIGFLTSVLIIYCIIMITIVIFKIIAKWKIFVKAGEKGWKSLIPIYNKVVLFKIAGISPWWVLGYFFAWIPIIGPMLAIGITIYAMINLSKAFGHESGFAVGLILLNTIFIMILGFGKSEYQFNKEQVIEEAEKTE